MRDLRKYASQTNTRLLAGFLFILVFVGLGLVYLFYGQAAAFMGLLCVAGGLSPLLLIRLSLWALELLLNRIGGD